MRKNKPAKCLHVGIFSDGMYIVPEFEHHAQANINTLALCMLCSRVLRTRHSGFWRVHGGKTNMRAGSHCF